MLFHLTKNDGTANIRLKEGPVLREDREINKWETGKAYEPPSEIELVLCNVKINQKMQVRYAKWWTPNISFSSSLISPKTKNTGVKVHLKVALGCVESMAATAAEPRNVIVGFANFDEKHFKGRSD
jgi:hypothetical protein